MSHDHDHAVANTSQKRRLAIVLATTIAIGATEVIGGLLAHSLALVADAGHMATDAAGIGLSLLAAWFASRPPNDNRTFGYQRAEILAAVANATLLLGVGTVIIGESIHRLFRPVHATPSSMAIFAIIAIIGNAVSLLALHRDHAKSLNMRGAYLEIAFDVCGGIAVLVAAGTIAVTGFVRADPIASLVVSALIVPRTFRLLREAVEVLLEATPRNVDLAAVRDHICETPGVLDVHDLHAWTIASGTPVLSAHVVVADAVLADGGGARILDNLDACLAGHFDVAHCTFQLEPASHRDHESLIHP